MDRSPEMKMKILDAAVSIIERDGHRAVRLRDVARAVGIAQPSLYHYFPNREELVVAAHARRLRTNLAVTIDPFLVAVRGCTSQAEFLTVLQGVFHHSYQPDRVAVRMTRAEIIGNAVRRADLQDRVTEALDESLTDSIEALDFAKNNGWLRQDIDTRAFAIFIVSLISSLVYPELYGETPMLTSWKSLALEAIAALVLNDSPSVQPAQELKSPKSPKKR